MIFSHSALALSFSFTCSVSFPPSLVSPLSSPAHRRATEYPDLASRPGLEDTGASRWLLLRPPSAPSWSVGSPAPSNTSGPFNSFATKLVTCLGHSSQALAPWRCSRRPPLPFGAPPFCGEDACPLAGPRQCLILSLFNMGKGCVIPFVSSSHLSFLFPFFVNLSLPHYAFFCSSIFITSAAFAFAVCLCEDGNRTRCPFPASRFLGRSCLRSKCHFFRLLVFLPHILYEKPASFLVRKKEM